MTKFSWKSLYCGTALVLLAPVSAWAQNADVKSDSDNPLGDIVITATRSETALQKTPVAVTALSAESLSQRNVTTLLDVASSVPSLSIGSRAGTGAAGGGVSIRGMGVDATDSQAAVGTYVDDVFFASGRGNILGLMDVQRVEVLRGPQGTLFGRNTIAGAIQYVTAAPKDEFGGYVTATAGNFDRADFAGAVNIPLTDTFKLRVAGLRNYRDGYVKDLTTGDNRGADRTTAARIKAQWTPTDRLTVDLKAEYMHERGNGRAVLVPSVNPLAAFVGLAASTGVDLSNYLTYASNSKNSFAGFDAPDYFKFTYGVTQGVITYDLNDNLTLKSITANSIYRSRLAQDLDNTPVPILSLGAGADNSEVFTQELQLSGRTLSDRLKFTVGAYYFDSKQATNPGRTQKFGNLPAFNAEGNQVVSIKSEALYGQATYDITDQLSVDLGLRYSSEDNEVALAGQTNYTKSSFEDVSPHLGLNFQANSDMLYYIKASKGFRAGGQTPNASLPGGAVSFDPETAWTYEAGARLQFLDGKLRFNPTVFQTKWKKIQFNELVFLPGGAVAVDTANAGDAEINGLELETQFAATDKLNLHATLSLLDASYTKISLPTLTLATPLQRAPETKYSVGANYRQPLANEGELVGSVDYAWTDDAFAGVTDSDQVLMPSYGLLNARLQYNAPGERFSVALFGTNITDETYLIGGAAFGRGFTAGADENDPGRPQEYGVELKVNF